MTVIVETVKMILCVIVLLNMMTSNLKIIDNVIVKNTQRILGVIVKVKNVIALINLIFINVAQKNKRRK